MNTEEYLKTASSFYIKQVKSAVVLAHVFTSFAESDIRTGTDPEEALATVTKATVLTVADTFDQAAKAMNRIKEGVMNEEPVRASEAGQIEADIECLRALVRSLMSLDFTMGLLEEIDRQQTEKTPA